MCIISIIVNVEIRIVFFDTHVEKERMSKILKSWSKMRKYLEKEMLADSLQGKVRYNCTTYAGMDGCHIFEVFFDGELFKQFSLETVNSYFIKMGYIEKPAHMTTSDYWKDFWELADKYPLDSLIGANGVIVNKSKTVKPSYELFFIQYRLDDCDEMIFVYRSENKNVIEIVVSPTGDITQSEISHMFGSIRY